MATPKQVAYIIRLGSQLGMSSSWANASWKGYLSLRKRGGRIETALAGLNNSEASDLIDELKADLAKPPALKPPPPAPRVSEPDATQTASPPSKTPRRRRALTQREIGAAVDRAIERSKC